MSFNIPNSFKSLERKVVNGVKTFAFNRTQKAQAYNPNDAAGSLPQYLLEREGAKNNIITQHKFTTASGIPYVATQEFGDKGLWSLRSTAPIGVRTASSSPQNKIEKEIADDFTKNVVSKYANVEGILPWKEFYGSVRPLDAFHHFQETNGSDYGSTDPRGVNPDIQYLSQVKRLSPKTYYDVPPVGSKYYEGLLDNKEFVLDKYDDFHLPFLSSLKGSPNKGDPQYLTGDYEGASIGGAELITIYKNAPNGAALKAKYGEPTGRNYQRYSRGELWPITRSRYYEQP